jgi:CIC family chloride channel protein
MKTPRFVFRIAGWKNRHIQNSQFVLILSFITGIMSGLAAVLLKNTVHYTFYIISSGFQFGRQNFLYLLLPLAGIVLTVVFVRLILKKEISHGISRILYAISKRNGIVEAHHTFSSMIGSTLTVAFGGSVGLEAPITTTGSAIGSNLGRLFRLNHKTLIVLIGCGAAGAIGGIFKAPIAAVVFAIEVLMIDLTLTTLIPLLISAVTGATVAYFLSGRNILFFFELSDPFVLKQIPLFLVLGIFTGLTSVYFSRTTEYIEDRFRNIGKHYIRIATGGTILGILIFVFPALFGEGYPVLQEVLKGKGHELINQDLFFSVKDQSLFLLLVVFAILVLKAVATAVTTGSGGVGGIFAPSLFMGGMAGYFVAGVLNLLGFTQVSESNFALVGMAGVMSGVMHAPLTGIFLIAEITGGFELLTPLIITSTISFLTVNYFEPHSIYSKKLAQRGELFTHHKDKAVLSLMKVKNLLETNFKTVGPEATLGDLVKIIAQSQRNVFPVVDSGNNFYGVVFINDIRHIIFERELYDTTSIRDLMFMPEPLVDPDESMEDIAKKFGESQHYNLPVIKDGKYLGFVSRANVFSNYRKLLKEYSDE